MTDRYDEMSVLPDPMRAEVLRQRLHARMAGVSSDDLDGRLQLDFDTVHPDPDDHPVGMKEPYMPVDSPTKSKNRWRMPAVAAAVVTVIGVGGVALAIDDTGSDDADTSSEAAPLVPLSTATWAPAELNRVTGYFSGTADFFPVSYIVPAGWELDEGVAVIKSGPDPVSGVSFFDIGQLYADPCQWVLVDPPVGPTVEDLVSAWADLPDFAATAAVDAAIDGYAGKQIEFTVPDYDEDECKGSRFGLWREDGRTSSVLSPDRHAQGPGQQNRQWILDVDGTRLVVTASHFPDTSPQDRAAIEEIVASIQIG